MIEEPTQKKLATQFCLLFFSGLFILWPSKNFQFIIPNSPFPIFNSQFSIHNSKFPIHHFQFTIHHSQFSIHHSQFSIHHSPLIIFFKKIPCKISKHFLYYHTTICNLLQTIFLSGFRKKPHKLVASCCDFDFC